MAKVDFSKLKKLPPETRIKALNKLEEELNKLINDRQKDIEEAMSLLNEAKREMRILEDIETPTVKKIEIEKLFEKEETEVKEKVELEKIAEEAKQPLPAEREEYAKFMAEQMSVDQIYDKLRDISNEQRETGVETMYHNDFVDAASRAIYFKKQASEEGTYTPPDKEKAEELMTSSEKMIKYLKGD